MATKYHLLRCVILTVTVLLSISTTQAQTVLDGIINVINQRSETVSVSVDGKSIGQVRGHQSHSFRNVPNGLRILTIKSPTVREINTRIQVPVSGQVSFTVVPQERRITVTNPNQRDVWLLLDGRRLRVIRALGTASLKISFGTHMLGVQPVGGTNGHIAQSSIIVRRDASPLIQLPLYFSSLRIEGTAIERASVFIDGKPRLPLIRGQAATINDVEPGRHRVEIRTKNRLVASTLLTFRSGEAELWRPAVNQKANLKVINPRGHTIQFQINGRRAVSVAPHSHTFVKNLPVGDHELRWFGPKGRSRTKTISVPASGGSFTIPLRGQRNSRIKPTQLSF